MARRKIRIDERQNIRRQYEVRKERRLRLRTRIKRRTIQALERAKWNNRLRARYYAERIETWIVRKVIERLPEDVKEEVVRFYLMELEEARDVWEWLEFIATRMFDVGYFRFRIVHDIEIRTAWKVYELLYRTPSIKVIVYTNAYSDSIRDRHFWENFKDYSEYAIYNVIDMVVSKIEQCPTENVPDPWQKLFLEYYVPFFKRKMCRSGMLAIKVTPITIRFIRNRKGSMYVARYVPVFVLRADVWATRTIPVDRHFKIMAWRKEVTEYVSTRVYAGTDIITDESVVVTGRDFLRRDYRIRRLRDVLFRPYTAVHDFCRTIGRPDAWVDIDHCSIYCILERTPRTARVYERYKKADDMLRYWSVLQGHGSMRFTF